MSRPSLHQAPIVRHETTNLPGLGTSPALDEELPKVVEDVDATDAQATRYSKYSKVLVAQAWRKKALAPRHLSEFCKDSGHFPSPLKDHPSTRGLGIKFVDNDETILVDVISHSNYSTISREFLRAGPREYLAFHPRTQVKACIVTCGGLCPGINVIIRELTITLTAMYGIREVCGIPFGYRGFYSTRTEVVPLDEKVVKYIHHEGGSFLGSSRGGHDTKMICDSIQAFGFNQVYVIGGDGTHRGAIKIARELRNRKAKVAVIGIPKTIDNDIALIDKSFGFDSAVEASVNYIRCAFNEARSAPNGIGLVKLMGRHSGQIAMMSTLASREVDCCLIPEIKFTLEGPKGLFRYIESRFDKQGYCVIVVAEGAGIDLFDMNRDSMERDPSGNVKPPDIAAWLQQKINGHFKRLDQEVNLKVISPTYAIRSIVANASDSLYCGLLAQSACHGAMCGFTEFTVGLVNTHFVMIPMDEIANRPRVRVDVRSRMWHRVVACTGQSDLRGVEAIPEPPSDSSASDLEEGYKTTE